MIQKGFTYGEIRTSALIRLRVVLWRSCQTSVIRVRLCTRNKTSFGGHLLPMSNFFVCNLATGRADRRWTMSRVHPPA
jgi:hypothetical protein